MKLASKHLLFALSLFFLLLAAPAIAAPNCEAPKGCVVELPESRCGEGTTNHAHVINRHSDKLVIFLSGGGVCWNGHCCNPITKVCSNSKLAKPSEANLRAIFTSNGGWADASEHHSPFKDYNVVKLPACTGDGYSGNRLVQLSPDGDPDPLRVYHYGYRNVTEAFKLAKDHFPKMDKVVLLGSSEGGIGVLFNAHKIRDFFPAAKGYAIIEAALAFESPFVFGSNLRRTLNGWGSNLAYPGLSSFGQLFAHIRRHSPNLRLATINSIDDSIMINNCSVLGSRYLRLFGFSLCAREQLIRTTRTHIQSSPNFRAFHLFGNRHVLSGGPYPPTHYKTKGVRLSSWIKRMLNDDPNWKDVRLDANQPD